jgi:flagellar L-ring protein precursor FlgH
MNSTVKSALILVIRFFWMAGLVGCGSPMLVQQGETEFAPALPVAYGPVFQENGSIYQAGYSKAWFEDITARQVGDLLKILLDEQTDATKQASTGITKDNSTEISAPTVLGKDITLNGNPLSTSLESANDFSGKSDSSQSNKLQGSITVTVSQVLPNGNLVVQGEKWISINQGDEYVRLRGIVRTVDITPDNTVLSTQVGNAQMTYRGKGAPAEANAMGWLARFFNTPIWPY